MDEQKNQIGEDGVPEPRQGLRSSTGMIDFGIQIGQYVVHRGPTEWALGHVPDQLAGPLRRVIAAGMREVGKRVLLPENELQASMNGKMFMNTLEPETGKPLFSAVPDDYIKNLFPRGRQQDWPQQLILCTKDVRTDPAILRKTMLNIPDVIGEILEKPSDVVDNLKDKASGRIVVLGVYHTEQDVMHNSAAVLDRLHTVRKDPLSPKGISQGAIAAGDALLSAMTLREDGEKKILRNDAPDILRHVMLHGYSQGGNIATDTFRHIRMTLRAGGYDLAQDARGTKTVSAASDAIIGKIVEGSYVLNIGGADLPYQKDEIAALPPRDNSRSDGDIIISLATDVNAKQANYHADWKLETPDTGRHDRLLETIGPKKRLFGFGEPHGKGYHAMLGHGEDEYRTSIVEQSGSALKERLTARFTHQPVVADITVDETGIRLDFECGSTIDNLRSTTKQLEKDLSASGVRIGKGDHSHQMLLHADLSFDTLAGLRGALEKGNVATSNEVGLMLNLESSLETLKETIPGMKDAKISLSQGEKGAIVTLTPPSEMGANARSLASRQLKNQGISQQGDGAFTISVSDAVAALKNQASKSPRAR